MEERCTHSCSDDVLSPASSCISEAVDGDDVSSCISEVVVSEGSDDDRQLLCLLDALDHLLCCRESLAKSLTKGWMEIASARYSMGPSRIDQALFSLKPCSASTVVSVSTPEDFVEVKSHVGEDEQESHANCAFQYSLRSPPKSDLDNHSASREETATSIVFPQSNLRQRHNSGLENKEHVDDDSEASVNHVLIKGRDMAQDGHRNSKHKSDVLAWFGTLVSPHLRAAQTSFAEALGTVVELAAAQSKILAACHQIKQGGGLI